MGRTLIVIGSLLIIAVTAASPASAKSSGQEDQYASVPIVQHSGGDRTLQWQFEQQWGVGGVADTLVVSIYPFNLAVVDVDESGRVYVLQGQESRVVVLSGQDGSLVGTVGRRGGGPGEMQSARALAVSGDSLLVVYDSNRGLVGWRLPTMDYHSFTQAAVRILSVNNLMAVDGGFVYSEIEFRFNANQIISREHVTWWTALETRRMISGREGTATTVDFPSCGVFDRGMPRVFRPSIPWHDRGNRLAIASDLEYVVYVFDDMQPTMQIRRSIDPRRANRQMALREMEGFAARPGCVVPADEAVRALGFEEYLQAVAKVAVGPDGGIWVLRGQVADEPSLIDVFGSDGHYVGTLPPGSPFPIAFLSSDRILVAALDELDAPTLTAYDVSR